MGRDTKVHRSANRITLRILSIVQAGPTFLNHGPLVEQNSGSNKLLRQIIYEHFIRGR